MKTLPLALSRVWTTCYSQGELRTIEVQVLIRNSLPRFDIIGLPQNVIREGKDRILSALSFLGIEIPAQKILVSLIPGDIPKEGSHFDLPILVGILEALGALKKTEGRAFYWGELNLNGGIRPHDDILAHILFADQLRPKRMTYPKPEMPNTIEFALPYLSIRPNALSHVQEFFADSTEKVTEESMAFAMGEFVNEQVLKNWIADTPDVARWNSLHGEPKQFLFWILAMLGRHHVLLEGPPGVGKSSWSYAVRDLQPPLDWDLWKDRFRFHPNLSSGSRTITDLTSPPFESPHHSSSRSSIVGGGSGQIVAGAITRANDGILFLDEFNEFPRDVLESLREPLENRTITIARRGSIQRLPANVQLIAAMNPCPCGNHRSKKLCTCSPTQFLRHQGKISGPIRDRFHLLAWWKYADHKSPPHLQLRHLRPRLVESKTCIPQLGGLKLPSQINPRRQRLWLELFVSWCQWHGLSYPSGLDQQNFQDFLEEMEHTDESDSQQCPAYSN